MPGNHRAESAARGPRRVWLLAIPLVIVLVAVALLVSTALHGGDHAPKAPTTPSVTPTTTTPGASPTATPTASHTKRAVQPKPAAVAADPPHRLLAGSVVDTGFGNALTTTSGRLIPDAPGEVQRVASRGMPGSPGTDTVVIIGAATTTGRGSFDDLGKVTVGGTVELDTYAGTLTYTVRAKPLVSPDAVLTLPQVQAHRPGRLVLVVAHYDNGNRIGKDLVVIAQLTKAVPIRP
jgi:hypothetical protein